MPLIKDAIKVTGKLNVKHIGKDGNTIREYNFKNLVVTTGLQHIAARLADSGTPDQMSHMSVGSGSTAPDLTDTTLGTELGRVGLTTAGGVPSGTTVTYTAAFPAGTATGALTEAGIFNASSSGTMLCRTTFLAINKGADDTLAVSWVLTLS
jgi:hypothetical protein